MGLHRCEYCHPDRLAETGSRDIILAFFQGGVYKVPSMLLHYVAEHGYKPPDHFVADVCHHSITPHMPEGVPVEKIGYLDGEYPRGKLPVKFFTLLWVAVRISERLLRYDQTRGG